MPPGKGAVMDIDTREYAPGDLRVSDADRDRALGALSEHFQAGRLTLEEFDERSGQALRAKTARELTELFTDLPRNQAGTAMTGDAVAVPEARPRLTAARAIVAAVAISAAVAIVFSVLARTGLAHHAGVGRRGFGLPVPIFLLFFIVMRLAWRRPRRRGAPPDAPVQDR